MEDGLNFDAANLDNAVAKVSPAFSPLRDAVLPGLAVLLFILIVMASINWARHRENVESSMRFRISSWPAALRVSVFPLLVGYLGTHLFAAFSVYYNTRVANPSSEAYWETMGVGRLSSLSHAHLFAHATMYFVMAALVQLTSSGRRARLYAPVAALWAGVFDVVAWWGLKNVSPSFEILSALSGSLFSLSFIVMALAIGREAMKKGA